MGIGLISGGHKVGAQLVLVALSFQLSALLATFSPSFLSLCLLLTDDWSLSLSPFPRFTDSPFPRFFSPVTPTKPYISYYLERFAIQQV
jgi:hypothetical protein